MKRKMPAAIAVICAAGLILGTTIWVHAATAKPVIIGFANMAANVEKSYGTVLELDLTLRNGEPVYKANLLVGGKRVPVYFNAVTGVEIERKDAVALDEDETALYYDYRIASSAGGRGKTSAEVAAGAQTRYSAEAKISHERAKEIALAKVGGGTVTEMDLDYEQGVLVYEAEIRYNGIEYEVDVNASTGEVVKFRSDHSSGGNPAGPTAAQQPAATSSQPQSGSSSPQISYEKAKDIAIAKVGGGTVRGIDLDYEGGRPVYEIEVRYGSREYEVYVDASTGEIVRYKMDD